MRHRVERCPPTVSVSALTHWYTAVLCWELQRRSHQSLPTKKSNSRPVEESADVPDVVLVLHVRLRFPYT